MATLDQIRRGIFDDNDSKTIKNININVQGVMKYSVYLVVC